MHADRANRKLKPLRKNVPKVEFEEEMQARREADAERACAAKSR